MKLLIIGSGGREHAFAKKLGASSLVKKVFVMPGNLGMSYTPKVELVEPQDCITSFCREQRVDLVVVGPELPLSNGIVDKLQRENIAVVGPTKSAARLESSKSFAKDFMRRHHIPTADFVTCSSIDQAEEFLDKHDKVVVKADGLAAGKGVFICSSSDEAKSVIQKVFSSDNFVVRDETIVVEEFMEGRELSVFVLAQGENFVSLGKACDYKRLFDKNIGPNTGGMGAYVPENWPSESVLGQVEKTIIGPTLKGMVADGNSFSGILYFGLMITEHGPKVVEYNVRFGDPEAQVVLPKIETDLVPLFVKVAKGSLDVNESILFDDLASVHVVMTSGGYANLEGHSMRLGCPINIINPEDQSIFYSGVKSNQQGCLVNSGGRVVGVTGRGNNIQKAREQAYSMIETIQFDGAHWRKDIGKN